MLMVSVERRNEQGSLIVTRLTLLYSVDKRSSNQFDDFFCLSIGDVLGHMYFEHTNGLFQTICSVHLQN